CAGAREPALASILLLFRGWHSSGPWRVPPYRPAGCNTTGNLFALLKPQRRHSSAARRRRDPSMESHNPLDAGLVPPFQRPRDGQHILPVLPALSRFALLLRREQYP